MPLDLPTSASQVVSRSKADVQRELQQSNPFLKNSWLGAIVTAAANRIYDFYIQLKAALLQSFPDTATGDYALRWGAIWGKTKLPATQASGKVAATGTAAASIPLGTAMVVSGSVYETTAGAAISAQVLSVASITRSGQTATATTTVPHNLANNVPVTISGAVQTEYNVSNAEITVIGLNTFAYQVAGAPATPATGTISASATFASVSIESVDFGEDTNLDAGTELRLQTPLAGVDDILTVDFGAIGGGTDEESDEAFRDRYLERIQNPVAHFNVAAITEKAREVAGVTRVFVQEVTPTPGQVTIYFMRDNDDNPIPDASEVAAVRAVILTIKPVNTSDDDVFVLAPTAVAVNFTFTALSPDTPTMHEAITANLQQLFDERVNVGEDVTEDAYRSAIFNTVDTTTGDIVSGFTLSAPSGDVAIADGEIGVLGTVAFP